MTEPAAISQTPARKATRVRASENALSVALKVARAEGLAVDKLLISGGRFELHFAGVERDASPEHDEGLEQW
ncbi:hypothetical protein PZ897_02230 [Hoeflea sp. YIM 152468]|uniref:hypothetical protein n=1 Tax=Hoeflea sp. YIM 152468 TaxID=3031759 RepID=UPI0023DB8349|nr:hypothetical protein [Hoeflea sp. YIM 152468]MDF1606988.1 hypothetical protein [Hoeflea sp. YIM 152468]